MENRLGETITSMSKELSRLGYSVSNKSLGLSSGKLLSSRQPFSIVERVFRHNLQNTLEILAWNEAAGIKMFRLDCGMIPRLNDLTLDETDKLLHNYEILPLIYDIADIVHSCNMRLTIHLPFTLNSNINYNSVAALADLMKLFCLDKGSFIIHCGGHPLKDYNPKENVQFLKELGVSILLENADNWSVTDTYNCALLYGFGMVYDIFHHQVYCNQIEGWFTPHTITEAIKLTKEVTELYCSTPPKFHISSQQPNCIVGTHATWVTWKDYNLLRNALDFPADVMIEAGAKEIAVQQLLHLTNQKRPLWRKT